jgi:8-oxo-dGTP pyrophosphatase MutT (NUDIX family)
MREAVIGLIERSGALLAVWNKRFEAWTLPGGKVEDFDANREDALMRELMEEIGVIAHGVSFVFRDVADRHPKGHGIVRVSTYRVALRDGATPVPLEAGCPICWMLPSDFLAQTHFPVYTERMFAVAGIRARRPNRSVAP